MFVELLQDPPASSTWSSPPTDSCKYCFLLCAYVCVYTSKNDNAVVLPVISLCFTVKRKNGKCKKEEKD